MKVSQKFKISIIIFLITVFSALNCIDVNQIRDTYAPLKQQFKRCSPVHGAIWWESELVKKYFYFGDFKRFEKTSWNGDATIALIHSLYHVVQGSFNVSQNNSYPAIHLSAITLGKMVGAIERAYADKYGEKQFNAQSLSKTILEDDDFKRSLEKTRSEQIRITAELDEFKTAHDELKKSASESMKQIKVFLGKEAKKTSIREFPSKVASEIEKLQKRILGLDEEIESLKSSEDQKSKNRLSRFKKQKDKEKRRLQGGQKILTQLFPFNEIIPKIKMYELRIKDLQKNLSNNNATQVEQRVFLLAKSIVDSCRECGYGNDVELKNLKYPLYATHSILLSVLYKKSRSKQDLRDFFNQLEMLGLDIFSGEEDKQSVLDSEEWLGFSYGLSDLAPIEEKIQEIKDTDTSVAILEHGLTYEDVVYALIINGFYSSGIPKLSQYATVNFDGVFFPDCMETMVRNLCNIILYKPSKLIFDLNIVPNLKSSDFDERVKTFYSNSQYSKSVLTDDQRIHQAWIEIIENRPFVAYLNLIHKETKTKYSLFSDGVFFLSGINEDFAEGISEKKEIRLLIAGEQRVFSQVVINGIKYILFDPEEYSAFEVQPSLKNTIILLNQFFNLGLYDDIQAAFFKPNFNNFYFSEFCKRLGLTYEDDDEDEDEEEEDLDKQDYTYKGISVSINKQDEECKLHINLDHGEVEFIADAQSFKFQNLFNILSTTIRGEEVNKNIWYFSIQLLSLCPLNLDKIEGFFSEVPHLLRLRLFFLMNIFNAEVKMRLIDKYLQKDEPIEEKRFLVKLISELSRDEEAFFGFGYGQQIVSILQQKGLLQDDEIKTVLNEFVIAASSGDIDCGRLFVLDGLVKNGYGLKNAISAVRRALDSQDAYTREAIFGPLIALVKQGEAIDLALKALELKVREGCEDVCNQINLALALIKVDRGKKEMLSFLDGYIDRKDFEEPSGELLDLMFRLVEKGEAFQQALFVASKGIKDEIKYFTTQKSLELLSILLDKDIDFKEKLNLTKIVFDRFGSWAQEGKYFNSKEGCCRAILEFANFGINQISDQILQEEAIQLFISLVKDQAVVSFWETGSKFIDDAVNAVKKGVESDNARMKEKAFILYDILKKSNVHQFTKEEVREFEEEKIPRIIPNALPLVEPIGES